MNNQLIKKIINSNDINACPELTYNNPLIDRNVVSALARSFVKILSVSQQDTNINNNLRHSVLANIRKLCQIEPENHFEVDESFTKSLSEVYMDTLRSSQANEIKNCVERSLDEFIIRRIKEVDINSNYQCSMNPEVAQALLNLNENHSNVESIFGDVLHWNIADKKNLSLVKNLWSDSSLDHSVSTNIYDEIAIKMRTEIEVILLKLCHRLLTEPNLKAEELFSVNILIDLVKKCAISSECFQICTKILNHLFINTNYNKDIQMFVINFINNVKANYSNSISVLYPVHLSSVVVLLDIDLDNLPKNIKSKYVEQTLVHLKKLQKESDSDLVLLLSHFTQWFPIYFH